MKRLTLALIICLFTLSANATTWFSGSTGNLDNKNSWWSNTNSTGSHPSDFTSNNQVFTIINNATPTITGNWVVSGTNSKIVVGNGTAINFTIPSGFSVSGTIDVSASAILTITNTVVPTLGTLNASSTVNYNASAGGQSITGITYGNLIIGNTSGTQTAAGTITVNGTFTTTSGGTLAMSTFQLAGTPTTVTHAGTITTNSIGNPAIPSGKSWVGTTGGVNFVASAGGQFIPAGTYKALTLSNTSGTNNAVGTVQIGDALTTTSGGTFSMGSFQLLGSIATLTNNGTISTTCTANPAIPTGKNWSGTIGAVIFAAPTGNQTVSAGTYKDLAVNNTSGTTTAGGAMTVNGALTTASGGVFAMTTFQLLGAPTSVTNNGSITTSCAVSPAIPSGKNWTGTTGLVNFAATTGGQFIPAGTYGGLTLSNSSNSNTAVGTLTVNGDLVTTSGGTLSMSTFQLAGTPTSVTNGGAVTTSSTANPALPPGKSWSGATGSVTFAATGGGQFIPSGTYKDLTLSNTSSTNTAAGILTVNGALTTTSAGTLDMSTFQLLGTLATLTNNGSITTSSTANPAIPSAKSWTGTTGGVTFAATGGGQFIPAGTFNDLTLSNTTGTTTAAGALTVNGVLTTTSGGTLSLSTFQLLGTISTLTNNGTISTSCTTNPPIPTGRNWSGTTGGVTFAALAGTQSIPAGTYKDLTLSNATGINTATGTLTVNGVLTTTSGGTLALTTFQLLGTPTSVTNNGTITTTSTANPAIPTGKSWTGTTGLVNFAATTGGQFIPAGTYGALTLSNSSNTNTGVGTLTVNGDLATTSGGTLAMSTFQLAGTPTSVTNNGTITTSSTANPALPAGQSWSGTTGLVTFAVTGGGQFIPAGTYKDLTLNNTTGTNTAAGILTVNGALTTTSGGTLDMSTFQLTGSLASLTNNGTITTSSTANPALPAAKSWSGTTGVVTFVSTTGGQFIPAGTYKDLNLNNTSGTNTAVGALTVNNTLTTTSGGSLAMSTFQLLGTITTLTNNGTITTTCTTNPALPTGRSWSGTTGAVTFAAATGAQFIPAGTFKDLTVSNTTGTTTAAGILTVNGALTTTSGGIIDLSTFQLLGTLTSVINNGSISTSSTANPAIPTGKTWTGTTGLVNFAATTGGQFIPVGTYGGLTLSNSSNTTTAAGALTVNGALTTTSGGTLAMSAFQLLGALTSVTNNGTITTTSTANPAMPTGKSWTGTTGLVNFAATTGGQFIPVGTYGGLTLSNSSNTNTAVGIVTVNGDLVTTSGGTLAMSTFQLAGTPTSVTNNGTITTSSTANPALPAGQSWSGATGLVTFAVTGGGQFVPAGTYKDLALSNSSGTNFAAGILTVNGALTTTSGGTLDMYIFQLLGTLTTLTNNGTITTSSTANPALPAAKSWSGTTGVVTFVPTTGGQFIPAGTYKDLNLNNTSGTNTAVGALTVNNALTTTSGGSLAMSTFQLLGTITTLTNNGSITTTCTTNPALPSGRSWSGTTGAVTFAAATGAQFIPAGTFKDLTVSNTTGTTTAAGILTVNGALTTTSGGIVDLSTFQLLGTLTSVINNGSISTSSTANPAIPTGKSWTGTTGLVNFAATTGGQFIPSGTYGGLTLSNSSNTTTATGALTVNGALTTTSGGTLAMSSFQLLGTVTSVANNGTITTTSTSNPAIPTGKNWTGTTGLVNFAATTGGQFIPAGTYGALTSGNSSNVNTAVGIVTVNGDLATTSGGTLAMSTFQLAGTPTSVTNNGTITTSSTANPALPAGQSWSGTTGLVTFAVTGGGQFLPAGTYKDLTISNTSGTNTAAGILTVNGALTTTSGGTLDMSTFQLAGSLTSLTNNGTITTSSTANPALPTAKSWSGTTGVVTFVPTTGGQFIPAGTYKDLNLNNTSGTNTAVGALTVNNALTTTSGGSLAMSTFQLLGTITTLTNNGTITTTCTTNPALPTGRSWSGTTGAVTFAATAGGQSIPAGTYKDLTVSNTTGTTTAAGIVTVNGALTTTSGGIVDLSTFQLLGTLTSVINNGSISTSSTANPAIPTGKTWTGTTGLVNFAATTGGQFIPVGTYGGLTLSNSSNTNTAAGALTVNGALTTTSGGTLAMSAFQLLGALTSVTNNGTITTTSTANPAIPTGKNWTGTTGLVNFAAAAGGQFIPTGTYGGLTLSNSSNTNTAIGIVTVNGGLTTTSGGTLAMSTFQLAGTPTSVTNNGTITTSSTANPALPASQSWSGTTGLVFFGVAGGGQFIPAGTYKDLTLNNATGTNTAVGILTVNGALTNTSGGTLALSTFQLLGSLATLTNNGTITTLSTDNPAIPSGKNWSGTTGLVNFAATTGGQFIPAGTYKGLTFSNTSASNTATGSLTVTGTLTTSGAGGILNMGTNLLSASAATITNTGTLQTQNTSSLPVPTGKSWTGLVEYNATTGNQTIVGGTYNSLALSGARAGSPSVTLESGTITVSGSFNATATGIGGYVNTSNTFIYTGSGQAVAGITYNNLTLANTTGINTASAAVTVSGALVTTSGGTFALSTFQLLGTPASVTNNGTITTASTANSAIPTGQNWTGTTGLVNFSPTGGGQFIPAGTYKDLTLGNTSGTNTATGILTINGTLTTTSGGTLDMSAFQLLSSLGTLTNNGTISTISTANPAIPSGKSWSGTTGGVNFAAAAGGQFIPAGTYKGIACSNTSGTNTATGTLVVTGTMTTSGVGGTLNMGTNLLSASAATITNTGTLQTQNTSSLPVPTGKSWAGTVEYNGTTGNQTIVAGTYTNLALSGTRTGSPSVTLESGTISVSGSFNATATGIGSYVNTTNTFIYTGSSQNVAGISYNNLTLANTTGTNTAGGAITVNGALTTTSGGTLALSTFQLLGTLSSVTNNGSITTACTSSPAIPTGKSWIGTTGVVNFVATTGGQFIPIGTYKGFTCSNTSGTNAVLGAITINGTLATTSGGTMDMGSFQLLGTITSVTHNGTLSTNCTVNPPFPTALNWSGSGGTSLVTLAASAGSQFIPIGTYKSITLGNTSGTNTALGALTINGTLTTTSGGTLAMSTFQMLGALASVVHNGTITTGNTTNPPIPAGRDWSGTGGTSLVTFTVAAGGQSIPAGTYKGLTLSNTSGTNTAVGSFVVNGPLTTTSGGTLAMTTFQMSGNPSSVTHNGTITTTSTANPALPSGANWSGTGGTSQVTFAATTGGQSIPAGTFKGLTLSNTSATDTAVGAVTVNGTLITTSGGTLAMGDSRLAGTPTAVTNNGTVTTSCTVNPAIPAGQTWVGTKGIMIFSATGGNQFIPAGTYKTLTCNNTSNTNTAVGNLNVTGTITTSGAGGTLDMGTNTLAAVGVTNTGTTLTQNTSSVPLPSGLTWAGLVGYNGTGNQTMVTGTFVNLALSGARASSPVITLASGAISLSGSFTVSYTGTPSFTNTGNTFTYSGNTAQTVGGITYNNLSCTNSAAAGTKTAGGNVVVNGTLTTTSGGTLALANYQLSGTLATVTNNGSISTTCTVNPAMPSGKTWSGTTGLVTFGAATGGQYIPGGTYKTLTCSNTSGTNTAVGNLNVTGTITTSGSGGTLDMGTNTLAAVGVTNTGTTLTQNTSSTPLPSGLTWAGMLNYNGAGSQTMVTGTFVNLALSGARASTPAITLASGAISLSGSFTVSYTGAVSFVNTGNTFTYTGNTIQTVGGITYNNLSCTNSSGSTPKNAGGNIAVNGTLTTTSGGTLAMGDYQLSGHPTTVTDNGTISTTCTLNPAIPAGQNWTGTTGAVIFAATTGKQYIPAGSYKTLTCSNTTDTNRVTGGKVTVAGVFIANGAGGKLDMGTNELTATTITNNTTGTLMTQCATSTPLPSGRVYDGTVNYNATAGGQTVIQGTYKNLTVGNTSDTSQASGNLTVNGTLSMSGGSLKMGTFTISGNASFASSGAGTITTANTSTTPLKTSIAWAQTILYNGTTGAQTIIVGTYNAGLVNANLSNTNAVAGNISISGNLTLASGSVLDDGGFQLTLNGNIAGTGTHIKTTAGSINMTASGGTISGATLGNLILNNSGGFSLTGDATINGTLTLTSGRLAIGSNNLTLGTTAPAISGTFSSSKMIVTNGTGKVRKMYTANGSYLFPLGDNTPNYSPVTINFTGGSYAGGSYAAVSVTNTKHPNDASLTNYLKRYWSVATSGITSPVYSVSATYVDADVVGDETAISSAKYAGSLPWTKYSAVNAVTNNISTTSVTNTSADFGGITTNNVSVFILPFSSTICNGGNVSLAATGAGTPPYTYSWSPATGLSATTGATVLASPTTTGTVSSTYIYTVTITDAQGTSSTAITTVTVQPLPPAITGDSTICNGLSTTLANAVTGGSWTSGNESVATITSPDGVLSAIAPGTAIITYSTGGGCSKTKHVTVNSIPSVDPITGPSSLCEDAVDYLASTTAGGTWSSGAPAIVTVDTSTGLITGISGGSSSISYNVTNASGCSTTVTTNIIVNAKPHVQIITGTPSVCFGTATQLNDSTTGGFWLSLDSTLAAVDTTGAVTGTIGVAWDTSVNVLYIAANDCGMDTAQQTVTIKGLPGVGVIVASNNHQVCLGATALYSSTHPGGVWSMSDTTIASIDSTGLLTGVSAGVATISYTVTGSNGCSKTRLTGITVNSLPPVPTIDAAGGLGCTGSTITLSGTTGAGSHVWTSTDTTIATIDPSTGILTGQGIGTTVITYAFTYVCTNYASTIITVNPTTSASVTGTASVCASGGVTAFAGLPVGGVWSSSNEMRATVDTSGIVTGGGIGTATISYVYTNGYGCAGGVNTVVTINALPTVASVAGTGNVCQGATITLTDPTTGGVWSSIAPGIATVGSTGVVTGVSPGTAIISYTVTGSNGCSKASKLTVTVNALPYVAPITSGSGEVCSGSLLSLLDTSSGTHLWTSDNTGVATVNSSTGVVTAVAAGTATISYKYTSGCSNYATTIITVNPITTLTVTGTPVVCAGGSTIGLTGAPGAGTWYSNAPTKASIDSVSGTITGLIAGTALITYTLSNGDGCVSSAYITATVNAQPAVATISGVSSVCDGLTTAFTDATTGGAWSSGSVGIATVGTSGIVTGIDAGTVTISYSVVGANGCSKVVTKALTVNALPDVAAIGAGSGAVCSGATLTLSDTTSGTHLWTSDNTGVATINSSTGVVTGTGAGTATISYKYTATCINYATTIITVSPVTAASVTGTQVVCAGGSTITMSGAPGSGLWYSNYPTKASVDSASGVITGLTAGTVIITYKYTNEYGCITRVYTPATVNALPAVAGISGATSVCVAATASLTETTTGGVWSSMNTGIALVGTSGVMTGVAAGTTKISYTVTGSNGCIANATKIITVNALPTVSAIVAGSGTVNTGATLMLSDATTGTHTWSSGSTGIASVNPTTGLVSGVAPGTVTISYAFTSGCTNYATTIVTVNPAAKHAQASPAPVVSTEPKLELIVYPNPTTGTFSIKNGGEGYFSVYSLEGKAVAKYIVHSGLSVLSLPHELTAGVYMCSYDGADGSRVIVRLVYEP